MRPKFDPRIISLGLGIVGSILVIVSFFNFGIGLEPDSASYLAAAGNLLNGKGFISFDGRALTLFPPLYSILIVFLSFLLQANPVSSAAILNVILFGLIIFKSGSLLIEYVDSKFLIIIGILLIIFSEPIFSDSLWALSDLLFIYILLLYLSFFLSYLKTNNFKTFLILILISAVAALTRYIGIILPFTTIIVLLISNRNKVKKDFKIILIYLILSYLPIGVWIIRNYLISGTFAGDRGQSRFSFFTNIDRSIHVLLDWFLPGLFGEHKILVLMILSPTMVVGFLHLKKIINRNLFLKFKSTRSVILIVFVAIYFFFMILVETFKAQSAVDSRLLSPMYIPIIFLLMVFLQAIFYSISSLRTYKIIYAIILAFLFIWISDMSLSTVNVVKYHFYDGAGYYSKIWKNDYAADLNKLISRNAITDITLYSNDPYPLYFYLNEPIKLSPMRTYEHSNQIFSTLSNIKGKWPSANKAFLIWSKNKNDINGWLFNQTELSLISDMKLVNSTNFWTLYSVKIKKK